MTGIALPRSRRKRRRPFGPREKAALLWMGIGVFCVCMNFIFIAGDMNNSRVDFWTGFDVLMTVFWVRVVLPAEWKILRAWFDSGDDA